MRLRCCVLGIVDGKVYEARAAINRYIKIALANLTVGSPQLSQVFDVDVT
jgi:hypothetical protein